MNSIDDEELINNPTIRRAVLAYETAASEPAQVRSSRDAIEWLCRGILIGVLLIVLIGLLHLAC
jgi:hypothetical protein